MLGEGKCAKLVGNSSKPRQDPWVSFSYLTVKADSASSVVSVRVNAASPLIHLGVIVTVKGVAVAVTSCNTNTVQSM